MQPTTFPIVAEARMAERLLEVERERLARVVAMTQGSRTSKKLTVTEGRHGWATRLRSTSMTGLAIAGCLALGGLSAVADGNADAFVVPTPPPDPDLMRPALVSGGWLCLSHGWCEARLSDRRVSEGGPTFDVTLTSVGDRPLTGTFALAGPDGEWVGPVVVTWDDRLGDAGLFTAAGHVLGVEGVFTLQGTAAYEGWAFVGAWSDPMTGEPARVSGVIYEGRPLDIDDLLPARAVGLSAAGSAPDGLVDQALAPDGPDRGPAPTPEQGPLPANPCGLPLFGWPVGPTAWSVGVSIPALPYLAIAACPLP